MTSNLKSAGALLVPLLALGGRMIGDVGALSGSSPTHYRVVTRDSWSNTEYLADGESIAKLDAGSVLWRTKIASDKGARVISLAHSRYNGHIYAGGFRPGGGFLSQVGPSGEKISYRRLNSPASAVAIDWNGDLYVAGEGFLEKLTAELSSVYKLPVEGRVSGLAVDSNGATYALISGTRPRLGRLDEFGDGWAWETSLPANSDSSIMVDCTGTIYVSGAGHSYAFNAGGEPNRLEAWHRPPTELRRPISRKQPL